jgi:beta-lactamase class C
VLLPALGLKNTYIDVPRQAMGGYAFGYDRKTDKPIRATPGILDAETYGIKSSARDMLALLDIELGRGDLSAQLKAAIERTHQGQFETAKFTQDIIWEQYPWPADLETMVAGNSNDVIMNPQQVRKIEPTLAPRNDVILNKTGSTNGFGGYVVLVPAENLGIVVLANRNYPNEARVRATYALIQSLLSK